MTVAELIERLNDMPLEAVVWCDYFTGWKNATSPAEDIRLEAGNPGVVVIDC